jgi:hypothetical protein
MDETGLWSAKADDWTIQYVRSDSLPIPFPLGYAWHYFNLASKSAKYADSFLFSGPSFEVDLKIEKMVDKVRELFKRLPELPSDEPFWPLQVTTAFSAYDLNYAQGQLFLVEAGTGQALRFCAQRFADAAPVLGSYRKPIGKYFEQPGLGLPLSGKFPNLAASAVDGTWYRLEK